MLADSINLPLVAIFGLVAFIPLTLVVVTMEWLVFWKLFHIGPGKTFKPLLIANIFSTIAGWILYGFQDGFLYLIGIRTLVDFAHYYFYGALLLIVLYYGKSVFVEGLYLARKTFAERLGAKRSRLWIAVLLGNMASYCLVGPLFYFSTRPNFRGLEFVHSPAQVSSCRDTIYFISSGTHFLERIRTDGTERTTVVSYEIGSEYLVSADEKTFLYQGKDGNLWCCDLGGKPVEIPNVPSRVWISEVDLSADKNYIAYVAGTQLAVWSRQENRVVAETTMQNEPFFIHLAWDSHQTDVLGFYENGSMHCWRFHQGKLLPILTDIQPVGNYRTDIHSRQFYGQEKDGLVLYPMPGLGQHVRITKDDKLVVLFRNNYGMLQLGFPGPNDAFFLSQPGLILCQGSGSIYVLDAFTKKVAVLAEGWDAISDTSFFQTSFTKKK